MGACATTRGLNVRSRHAAAAGSDARIPSASRLAAPNN